VYVVLAKLLTCMHATARVSKTYIDSVTSQQLPADTMNNQKVNSCPSTKPDGGLQSLQGHYRNVRYILAFLKRPIFV